MRARCSLLVWLGCWFLTGCALVPPSKTPTTQSEAEIRALLVGPWQMDQCSMTGGVYATSNYNYEFFADGRFVYHAGPYEFNGQPPTWEEYTGRWQVKGPVLVRRWTQEPPSATATAQLTVVRITGRRLWMWDSYDLPQNFRRPTPRNQALQGTFGHRKPGVAGAFASTSPTPRSREQTTNHP